MLISKLERRTQAALGAGRWQIAIFTLACLLILAFYLSTLQADVNGNPSDYTDDVGEFQNALYLGGTLHHTGYPLYALTGFLFVRLATLFAVEPAAAASLFSLLWSMGTLVLVALTVHELGGKPIHATAAILLLAAARSFWIHSVVAEVYSLNAFLIALSFWLAMRTRRKPELLPWLAVALGLTLGHHRSSATILPCLLLYPAIVLPRAELTTRRVLVSIAAFVSKFLIYLYLPLRAWQGATWLFGRPDTVQGFLDIVLARGVGSLMQPETNPAIILQNLGIALSELLANLSAPGLLIGVAGLAIAVHRPGRRWEVAMLALSGAGFVAFAGPFPETVYVPALLLPTLFVLAVGLALFLNSVEQSKGSRVSLPAAALSAVLAAGLAAQTQPWVLSMVRYPRGRELIKEVAQAQLDHPLFIVPWGTDYFPLAYARQVSGELVGIGLERVDFAGLGNWLAQGNSVYVLRDVFYDFPVGKWWESQFGKIYLSSAGPGIVQLRTSPDRSKPQGVSQVARMGNSIVLLTPRLQADPVKPEASLTLYWRAARTPPRDYSVFVHLLDANGAMIGQSDSLHPVYGWFPTSQWVQGEIVREDYRLTWKPEQRPSIIAVGMYWQDEATGAFHNLGQYRIPFSIPQQ